MAEDHSFNKTEYFGNGSGQSNMFPVRVRSINLTENDYGSYPFDGPGSIGIIRFNKLNNVDYLEGMDSSPENEKAGYDGYARPLFPFMKYHPIPNEIVYLLHLPTKNNTSNIHNNSFYYFPPINLWNHPHNNIAPNVKSYLLNLDPADRIKKLKELGYEEYELAGFENITINSDGEKKDPSSKEFSELDDIDIPLGKYFREKGGLKPLQPYEGDYILEGRFGNSIRFGATSRSDSIPTGSKNPWSNGARGTNGEPITIIRNGQSSDKSDGKGWEHIIEDINYDPSSIYLTSNQKLDDLIVSSPHWNTFGVGADPLVQNDQKEAEKFTGNPVNYMLDEEVSTIPDKKGETIKIDELTGVYDASEDDQVDLLNRQYMDFEDVDSKLPESYIQADNSLTAGPGGLATNIEPPQFSPYAIHPNHALACSPREGTYYGEVVKCTWVRKYPNKNNPYDEDGNPQIPEYCMKTTTMTGDKNTWDIANIDFENSWLWVWTERHPLKYYQWDPAVTRSDDVIRGKWVPFISRYLFGRDNTTPAGVSKGGHKYAFKTVTSEVYIPYDGGHPVEELMNNLWENTNGSDIVPQWNDSYPTIVAGIPVYSPISGYVVTWKDKPVGDYKSSGTANMWGNQITIASDILRVPHYIWDGHSSVWTRALHQVQSYIDMDVEGQKDDASPYGPVYKPLSFFIAHFNYSPRHIKLGAYIEAGEFIGTMEEGPPDNFEHLHIAPSFGKYWDISSIRDYISADKQDTRHINDEANSSAKSSGWAGGSRFPGLRGSGELFRFRNNVGSGHSHTFTHQHDGKPIHTHVDSEHFHDRLLSLSEIKRMINRAHAWTDFYYQYKCKNCKLSLKRIAKMRKWHENL